MATRWKKWSGELLPALVGLYAILAVFFAPVVFEGRGLSPAADMVASAGMYKMGEEAISAGKVPLWNPTLFCGIPMFASLQYALFVYPLEYPVRLLSHIFGSGDYRVWLFHYLLAGFFAYLLARHLGCGRTAAWTSGVVYGFSPQLIVLADVGHGSKLMAMTYLPLLWLAADRLRLKPTVGRAMALGAVFAVEVLALHPQVAAYGAMLLAVHWLYYGVGAVRSGQTRAWIRYLMGLAGAGLVSAALSAVLWLSVLDYARFSIRGGGDAAAGGGVGWEYATGWSFHPLESVTYLFPGFMGFGGATYWGTVGTPQGQPFTHNPMYFGAVAVFLGLAAVVMRPKRDWGFAVVLAGAAWVLSFGRYLPVLYGPLFHLLPMFNKFRAPAMGQILLLLGASVAAGLGLEVLRRGAKGVGGGEVGTGVKVMAGVGSVMLGLGVVTAAAPTWFGEAYRGFASALKPDANPRVLEAAAAMARTDVVRVGLMLGVLGGAAWLALRRKLPTPMMTGLVLAALAVDLWSVNRKLVTFTPPGFKAELFTPDPLVKKMQSDRDKFRLHPLDGQYKPVNWWSYFGLETTTGYFGAKMAAYQQFMSTVGLETWEVVYSRPQILDALNVRYLVSSVPLPTVYAELERRGASRPERNLADWTPVVVTRGGGYLYRNPGELPRARLVGRYRVVEDLTRTLAEMVSGGWDPRREVLLDREPGIKPAEGAEGTAAVREYLPEQVVVECSADRPALLVLADTYYPSGWRATVDGAPVEILRADGVLRAVAVPAGVHRVEFRFKPGWFGVGAAVSSGAAAVMVLYGVAAALRRRRESSDARS